MTFAELKRSKYQQTAFSPLEPRPTGLVLSDMVAHLPVIEFFASKCQRCIELGVRDGNSTVALVAGCKGEVFSYDLEHTPFVHSFTSMEKPCGWKFQLGSSIDPFLSVPDSYGLVLFDTKHTYDHLKRELELWARKARFLIFHDTKTCADKDVSGPDPSMKGIMPAITEFMDKYGDYEVAYATETCNGLMVLEKVIVAEPVDNLPSPANLAVCQAASNG